MPVHRRAAQFRGGGGVTTPARAACIIGWPVKHSRSPLIHNYWLKHYGIAGEYRREEVPPEKFADFVKALGVRGYVGANVTVPHKEAALSLSQPDDRARAVGAANTLWHAGGLRSTNTDVEGFLDSLDARAPDWDRDLSKAVVLGAGGAARAVVYGSSPGALSASPSSTVHGAGRRRCASVSASRSRSPIGDTTSCWMVPGSW
jgi:shikimate 5-dehydrogenase